MGKHALSSFITLACHEYTMGGMQHRVKTNKLYLQSSLSHNLSHVVFFLYELSYFCFATTAFCRNFRKLKKNQLLTPIEEVLYFNIHLVSLFTSPDLSLNGWLFLHSVPYTACLTIFYSGCPFSPEASTRSL